MEWLLLSESARRTHPTFRISLIPFRRLTTVEWSIFDRYVLPALESIMSHLPPTVSAATRLLYPLVHHFLAYELGQSLETWGTSRWPLKCWMERCSELCKFHLLILLHFFHYWIRTEGNNEYESCLAPYLIDKLPKTYAFMGRFDK